MSDKLRVNEIFSSIDGEGKRAGELATFIRLTGCNLRCSYCDTRYAFNAGLNMSITDIVNKVKYYNVTLTGGEPLLYDVRPLLNELQYNSVNIETNGSRDITPYLDYENVFFTIDYKCKSSGESERMLMSNFEKLRHRDVLKFVVGSIEDLEQAKGIYEKYNPMAAIYVSPVFGKITPAEIVDFMQEHELEDWKIQLQLHKYIWEPTKRGV